MTCIVAVAQDGVVYMGGDASAVDENNNIISTRREPKVFIKKNYIIGYAGSFRFGKIAEHNFNPPPPEFDNLDKFFNTTFVDALRECCDAGKINPTEEDDASEMLIGVGGRIFEFCNDWHFGEDRHSFNAIGSGSSFALGSLYSTRRKKNPYARITSALESAEHFSSMVRGPFTLLEA